MLLPLVTPKSEAIEEIAEWNVKDSNILKSLW